MRLKDLKEGMICELRNGEILTVLDKGNYVRNHVNLLILSYNEDLTNVSTEELDIVEVYFEREVRFVRKR